MKRVPITRKRVQKEILALYQDDPRIKKILDSIEVDTDTRIEIEKAVVLAYWTGFSWGCY